MTRLRIVLAAIALVVAGLFAWEGFNAGTGRSLVGGMELGAPFALVDHNGQPVTQQAFEGHPSLLYFGFTRCPEVCPTTLFEMAGWFEALGEDGKELKAFFVTVDPERDTPEIMKGYAEAFSDRVTGITGPLDQVAPLLASWKVYYAKVPLDDGDYTMDHTASVFLLDRQGRFRGTIAYGEDKQAALEKLRRLVKG